MEFVIIWLICGGIAAMIASSKGGNGAIGFVVGLLFGPFGIIAAFFMGNEQKADANKIASGDSKKCPRCAELVKPDALVCKHCSHEFQAAAA
ncbi:zinc ribbon domain-containing protein [Sphingobium lactosutens]|uniref:zinc ribbon domain-containing protein n=1 Tax=Sphingobium lactosutens TaxID=522773 RepID=UPI0015C10C57|nr:zinc ribbon domain-containing protein [Sphingobium lactosutens]NWK96534.1 zinc ribbon domain-containing protein [Sphingobium lactosutens]